MLDSGTISGRSSIHFGIHSESKAHERRKKQNKQFTIVAACAILSLGFLLICLILIDLYNNANSMETSRKNSSYHSSYENLQDLMRMQQRMSAVTNIDLEPQSAEKKMDDLESERNFETFHTEERTKNEENAVPLLQKEYANHRYDTNNDQISERAGYRPRPFSMDSSYFLRNRSVNSIQDILGHETVMSGAHNVPTNFRPPLRFRGYYVKPDGVSMDDDRNDEYYRKINSFFSVNRDKTRNNYLSQNQDIEAQGTNLSPSVVSGLYTKAIFHNFNKSEPAKEIKKNWNAKNIKAKKKPFTVMLDIYPMEQEENTEASFNNYPGRTRPKEFLKYPPRLGEQYYQPTLESTLSTKNIPFVIPLKKKKNRMLMKLNLYPWQLNGQRRTWNFFNRSNNNVDAACQIPGHNPNGKPISAKWKDKNGEVIHAKVVALHQWDDDYDSEVDPR